MNSWNALSIAMQQKYFIPYCEKSLRRRIEARTQTERFGSEELKCLRTGLRLSFDTQFNVWNATAITNGRQTKSTHAWPLLLECFERWGNA
jgi:hypothetical protein